MPPKVASRAYRFVQVPPNPWARDVVHCFQCGRRIRFESTWADLNGPAFLANWCQECGERRIESEG